MTAVSFGVLWLSPAADTSTGRSFRLHELRAVPAVAVTAKRYAGGRVRLSRRAGGAVQQHSVTLRHLDRPSVAQLEEWAGELLLVRDPRGRKFYGFYAAPDITDRPTGTADVTLTLIEVTHAEAV